MEPNSNLLVVSHLGVGGKDDEQRLGQASKVLEFRHRADRTDNHLARVKKSLRITRKEEQKGT